MAEGNGRTFSPEVTELGDKIAALTIVKAVELKDYLKEKYNIEPAAGGVAIAAMPGVPAARTIPPPLAAMRGALGASDRLITPQRRRCGRRVARNRSEAYHRLPSSPIAPHGGSR